MTKKLPEAVKIIRCAKRLLKKGWTKTYFARNIKNEKCLSTDKKAVCWCMLGALNRASGHKWQMFISKSNIYKVFGEQAMCDFNDNANSVEEVLSALTHLEDLHAE